ncbi:MAG: MmcQ/YjbR family DNA-binding protein [Odoribacter sp.]
MNIEELTEYCQRLDHTKMEVLWGDVLVFKVGGRMFCFSPMNEELKMTLKCDPEEALELRERFTAVLPGYHMNKRYWNTVLIDGSVSDNMLRIWIEKSYQLVLSKLTKSERAQWDL